MRPAGVAGRADVAQLLTGEDGLLGRDDDRPLLAVGEEVVVAVGALLDDVVAGGVRLVVGERDRPGDRRHDGHALGGGDVLALVRVAVARGAEDVAVAMRPIDREHVPGGVRQRRGRRLGRTDGERRQARRAGLAREHRAAQTADVQAHAIAARRELGARRPRRDDALADVHGSEVQAHDRARLGHRQQHDARRHGVGAGLVDAQRDLRKLRSDHDARPDAEVARHRARRARADDRRAVLRAALDGRADGPAALGVRVSRGARGGGEDGERNGHPGRPADEREHPACHIQGRSAPLARVIASARQCTASKLRNLQRTCTSLTAAAFVPSPRPRRPWTAAR
jgi:hypothetical protein